MVERVNPLKFQQEFFGVKLISGLLSASETLLSGAKQVLERYYGPIDLQSPVIPFNFTDYYDEEIGKGILRQFISFSKLVRPEYISRIKRQTIRIERKFRRKVNIDPGYITLDKLVLATTKNATYRIYLGSGIYAQSTLFFQNGSLCPWNWTYPDYKTDMAIEFFNQVRNVYRVAAK